MKADIAKSASVPWQRSCLDENMKANMQIANMKANNSKLSFPLKIGKGISQVGAKAMNQCKYDQCLSPPPP